MGVKLVSSGGGSVEINPPATASNFVATMPAGTGTVSVNGVSSNIVSGTAVASTSGTSIDFTGIPSWVKRITVMFNGVSTNGTSAVQIQIGSGSVTTSGYNSKAGNMQGTSVDSGSSTTGFPECNDSAAGYVRWGQMILSLQTSNTWVYSSLMGVDNSGNNRIHWGGGSSSNLSGPLDRVRITTVGGTNTFDAGSINILYE